MPTNKTCSKVIGASLNSVTSLFNNSCDVNTVKFHQGRKTIMLARYFSLSQGIGWKVNSPPGETSKQEMRSQTSMANTISRQSIQFVDVKFHICIFNTGIITNTQKLSATVKSQDNYLMLWHIFIQSINFHLPRPCGWLASKSNRPYLNQNQSPIFLKPSGTSSRVFEAAVENINPGTKIGKTRSAPLPVFLCSLQVDITF